MDQASETGHEFSFNADQAQPLRQLDSVSRDRRGDGKSLAAFETPDLLLRP